MLKGNSLEKAITRANLGPIGKISLTHGLMGYILSGVNPQAPIAQLDRVTDYESGGWRFEPSWARHYYICRR